MIRRANQLLYCAFSATAVAFGLLSLFVNRGAVPFEQHHVERELGAAAVFVGLTAMWCLFNYERRRGVHAALLVFASLLALIHWQDFFAGHRGVRSIIYNSVPLAVLLLISGLAYLASAKKASSVQLTEKQGL
jgi:hypothetical protein